MCSRRRSRVRGRAVPPDRTLCRRPRRQHPREHDLLSSISVAPSTFCRSVSRPSRRSLSSRKPRPRSYVTIPVEKSTSSGPEVPVDRPVDSARQVSPHASSSSGGLRAPRTRRSRTLSQQAKPAPSATRTKLRTSILRSYTSLTTGSSSIKSRCVRRSRTVATSQRSSLTPKATSRRGRRSRGAWGGSR